MFVTNKMRTARLFTQAVTDSETDQDGILHVCSDASPRHGRPQAFMYLFADGRASVAFMWEHMDEDMNDIELRCYLSAVIDKYTAEPPA